MEHLQAKGLFEGSKLAGIFLPFNRWISFIFAGSSWISFVKVFSSKLRHSSRTRRITAAIVCGRGERNTRWAIIAQSRSMGQKSSIFGGNQKGWVWRRRWRVGVWLGKFSSMKSLFTFVECGLAKSCSNTIRAFDLNSFRLLIGRFEPFLFSSQKHFTLILSKWKVNRSHIFIFGHRKNKMVPKRPPQSLFAESSLGTSFRSHFPWTTQGGWVHGTTYLTSSCDSLETFSLVLQARFLRNEISPDRFGDCHSLQCPTSFHPW